MYLEAVFRFYVLLNHFVGHFFFGLVRFGSFSNTIYRNLALALSKLHINVDITVGFFVGRKNYRLLPMQYDVRIHSIQFDGPCRATASLNINGCFAVRGVKLMEGSNGLFVSMPGQINSKGEIKDICFPYTREARAELESAVVTAYQQALTQGMNRSPQSAPDPTAQQAQKMGM